MLFVRDFYKKSKQDNMTENIQNKSKYIANIWKNLNEKERKKYTDLAISKIDYYKKTYKKQRPTTIPKEIIKQINKTEEIKEMFYGK